MIYFSLLLQLGRLPIELSALRECKEEVEMLLPLTSPIPNVRNWSVDGVISHAKFEDTKPLVCYAYLFLDHFIVLLGCSCTILYC